MARLRIGELLVEARVISQAQLEDSLKARAEGQKLGAYLVEQGLVSEAQLTQILSQQLSVPWVSLYHIDFSRELLNRVPRALAERFAAVPIFVRHVKKQGNSLYVAMDDPTNEEALEEIGRAAGLPVKPMIACITDIRNAIRVYYAEGGVDTGAHEVPASVSATLPRSPVAPPAQAAQGAPPTLRAVAVAPPVPPPPPPVARQAPPPPPAPIVGRPPLATVVDTMEILSDEAVASVHSSHDSPDAEPELEVREYVPKTRMRPRMVSLTLLDGSTLNVPSPRGSSPGPISERSAPAAAPERLDEAPRPRPGSMPDQLTARDLVSALRAVAHGADATEVLGQTNWQAMFAALLSLMLKKNLISDWEFVEELRNI